MFGAGPLELLVILFAAAGGLVALALYVLPTIIAARRAHPSRVAIFALNLLLGLTVVGWIAALVWSLQALPAVARAAPSPGGSFCPACGKQREGSLGFCRHCGTALA